MPTGAVVVDANVAIAICAREAPRDLVANAELLRYASAGYQFFAPGAIVAETLFILCGKLQQGTLTGAEHAQAIGDFQILMSRVLPPPHGEAAIIARAEAIRDTYGCSRSADGIYIALAEELAAGFPTILLTFDKELQKQAARHAPVVQVQLLLV
jgi:predicted nucleic acid-binding protein